MNFFNKIIVNDRMYIFEYMFHNHRLLLLFTKLHYYYSIDFFDQKYDLNVLDKANIDKRKKKRVYTWNSRDNYSEPVLRIMPIILKTIKNLELNQNMFDGWLISEIGRVKLQ
ncbi:MAG: hypothetical protein BZ137_00265 [Methanosphaera sp. rholeuAM130]|nr:MAG: hypothetical protein BZ137_00265 [Methanosphaera sp. rholeuAM130]